MKTAKQKSKPNKPKRRLTRIRVGEISLVDDPAVADATFLLCKRDANAEDDDGPRDEHGFTRSERRALTVSANKLLTALQFTTKRMAEIEDRIIERQLRGPMERLNAALGAVDARLADLERQWDAIDAAAEHDADAAASASAAEEIRKGLCGRRPG